jgi:hypothetical protein
MPLFTHKILCPSPISVLSGPISGSYQFLSVILSVTILSVTILSVTVRDMVT